MTCPEIHEILFRNQVLMPDINSRLCTKEFMIGVISGQVHLPTMNNVVVRNCACPPPLIVILGEVQRLLNEKNAHLDVLTRKPDQEFALRLLSTLDPNHAVFSKEYVYVPHSENVDMKNLDRFRLGLPQRLLKPSKSKAGKKRVAKLLNLKRKPKDKSTDEVAAQLERMRIQAVDDTQSDDISRIDEVDSDYNPEDKH